MKKYKFSQVIGIVVIILCITYLIGRNKIENTLTIKNQTSESIPEITFYLTKSNSTDSQIEKGEQFGKIPSIPAGETEIVVSNVEILEDSNIVFEYMNNNDRVVVDYVNDYIPFDSKKYKMNLILLEVDGEGVFKYN